MARASDKKRIPNAVLGLILAIVLAIASYMAFTKDLPFAGGTEYKVAFNSAQNLRANTPVRIAGVEVGEVTGVEPLAPDSQELVTAQSGDSEGIQGSDAAGGAIVTMSIDDSGLPLKEDATFELRPRLFLEGNLFVDVRPGSPGSPAQDPDQTFSPAQTANSVQLDQILTGALQGDAREDLQVFLDEFGSALIDGGGAKSLRTLYKTSKGNFKNTSQVNEAVLGENPHDLSGLIFNLDKVIAGLGANERALQDTVTNLKTVTGSFAAQDQSLEQAVIELPQVLEAGGPAFANLNAAFPSLRAFAREALPGVRTAPETLDAATPLLNQVRLLSRKQELRGLARDLVPTVPNLARLVKRTPDFLEQGRTLASCFNQVIIPWSLDSVEGGAGYPYPATGEVYKETAYGLAGIAGESRSGDANGQYIRIAGGGGTNTVSVTGANGEALSGVTQFPIQGTTPAIESSAKTPLEPGIPCENQDAPDLRAGAVGAGPTNTSAPADAVPTSGSAAKIFQKSTNVLEGLNDAAVLEADGDKAAAKPVQKDALKKLQDFYDRFGD